jgi:hypothetical protein
MTIISCRKGLPSCSSGTPPGSKGCDKRWTKNPFLHLDSFDEEWSGVRLGDDGLQELRSAILAAPERYPILRGTAGLRKIRFAPSGEARCKRGAYRVGYVRFRKFGFILLVTAWGKNEK